MALAVATRVEALSDMDSEFYDAVTAVNDETTIFCVRMWCPRSSVLHQRPDPIVISGVGDIPALIAAVENALQNADGELYDVELRHSDNAVDEALRPGAGNALWRHLVNTVELRAYGLSWSGQIDFDAFPRLSRCIMDHFYMPIRVDLRGAGEKLVYFGYSYMQDFELIGLPEDGHAVTIDPH